jgi:hypothetical protein
MRPLYLAILALALPVSAQSSNMIPTPDEGSSTKMPNESSIPTGCTNGQWVQKDGKPEWSCPLSSPAPSKAAPDAGRCFEGSITDPSAWKYVPCTGDWPEVKSIQGVLTPAQQAAFPENAWMKPCGPTNHDDWCVDTSAPPSPEKAASPPSKAFPDANTVDWGPPSDAKDEEIAELRAENARLQARVNVLEDALRESMAAMKGAQKALESDRAKFDEIRRELELIRGSDPKKK